MSQFYSHRKCMKRRKFWANFFLAAKLANLAEKPARGRVTVPANRFLLSWPFA